MAVVDLGRVKGSLWYSGTGIAGTSTTPTEFPDSGVTDALDQDHYLNPTTGNVYRCVTGGDADTATWVYIGCILGPMPEVVDNLTSTSTSKALSANMGRVLSETIEGMQIYPYVIYPDASRTAYTASLTIENISTVITIDDGAEIGVYTYTASGDLPTATVSITLGTVIGFSQSGVVVKSIKSDSAQIIDVTLYDDNTEAIYTDTPKMWEHINTLEDEIEASSAITEEYEEGGETVTDTYKTSLIKKLMDGVRTLTFPVTHAKAVWFNKHENQTVYDEINRLLASRTPRDISSDLANLTTAIAEQNLAKYGYKIGDYFTGASGYRYWLADMDTFYGGYDYYAVLATHHIGIVVDTGANSIWHSSGISYINSTLHSFLSGTALNNIKSDIATLFGSWSEHLLANDKLYPTVSGSTLSWAWGGNGVQNQYISALTEVQVYGCPIWSANPYQQGEADKQLELFNKYKYNMIYGNNNHVWLRSLYAASAACIANCYGYASYGGVTNSFRASGLILLH